ncbi:uncharacterized protein PAC_19805 [Phialocephala subalpina]|uniref:Uncharacterized protein n=1 Tax=Phialocephala subalpina TaxID=576137 RepID=A0A1L7XY93_9HELO|nr:uncharacterized protein PAC_19805 [Phialocephala subalpina]
MAHHQNHHQKGPNHHVNHPNSNHPHPNTNHPNANHSNTQRPSANHHNMAPNHPNMSHPNQNFGHNQAHDRSLQHNGHIMGNVQHNHGDTYEEHLNNNGDGPSFNHLKQQQKDNQLIQAAARGESARVRNLLECGADVDYQHSNGPPLLQAARGCHYKCVEVLIDMGAEMYTQDQHCHTVMHWAVMNNDLKMVQLLLNKDFNSSFAGRRGQTPLHLAAQGKRTSIAKLLLDNGAKVGSFRLPHHGSPLIEALLYGGCLETVELLLEHRANYDTKTPEGVPAVAIAAAKNRGKVVEKLLTHGAKVEERHWSTPETRR